MNLSNELTKQVNAHLSEVRKYLGELPADERQEILQSVESHIYDALERRSDGQPTSELLAAVIAEMDPPESYGELSALKKKKFCWYIAIIVLTSIALMAIGIIWWPQQQSNPIETAHKKKSSQDGQSFQSMTRPVEHPSTPQPPSGKYAFQIIKIEAPEKIIPNNEIDIEAIIQYPEVTIFEYPTLIAGLGESITNDQTKSISMTTDGYGIEGKPIKLGSLTSVSVKETSETTVSYHILVSLKLLVGFTGSKTENGFTVKTNPIFKVRSIDTDQTQRFNSWRVLSELVQQKPNEEPIKELICIQVISPDKTHSKPKPSTVFSSITVTESTRPAPEPPSTNQLKEIGRWVSVDLVDAIGQFNPQSRTWTNGLYLEDLSFLAEGKTDKPWWIWKDGKLHHIEIGINAAYSIKEISGEEYLFLEWFQNARTYTRIKYYVFKRSAPEEAQDLFPRPVAFKQGRNTFKNGDAVILDEVLCSSPRFVIGDTVVIRGQYTLASHSNARLSLTTSATQGNGRSVLTEKQQTLLTKGKGQFELNFTIKNHGCSHLQMYDIQSGKSIGGLNFGTKQQIAEIEALGRKSSATVEPQPTDLVGRWQSVDFVESIEQFNPNHKTLNRDLYLKELTFLPDGKTDRPFWSWKDGVLHHSGDNTDAKFFIKTISGEAYLFLEWISKDVIEPGFPPKLYVFKKAQ
jgi:hypothetical protein